MTLNELIQKGIEKQKIHKAIAAQEKAAKADLEAAKEEIRMACEEAGVNSASIKGFANITLTEKRLPTVIDWDALAKFIKENDALHLFQKRINQSAYEEYLEQGTEIQGIEIFPKTTVTIRDLS